MTQTYVESEYEVTCESGGVVVLDRPLYRLWCLARQNRREADLSSWCEEEQQTSETGRLATALLFRAGLLPSDGSSGKTRSASFPDATSTGPLVSVILVNRDGRSHLERCLRSLEAQSYENLEVVVVDNGSTDDSVAWLGGQWPDVNVVSLTENLGFGGACNRGVEASHGALLFFLSGYATLDCRAVELLVERLQGEEHVGAVVPMVRSMSQPSFVNALGAKFSSRDGDGSAYLGHLDVGQFATVRRAASATFPAVLVPRSAFETTGLLDEVLGQFYGGLDWSWRARLKGLRILAESRALLFHATGSDGIKEPRADKLNFSIRDRLRFVLKNLKWRNSVRFVWRCFGEGITVDKKSDRNDHKSFLRQCATAWWETICMLPEILRQRRHVQRGRLTADEEILREMEEIPPARRQAPGPVLYLSHVTEDYGPHLLSAEVSPSLPHLLVLSHEISEEPSPVAGTRCWELAHILSDVVDVTLATPGKTDSTSEKVSLKVFDPQDESSTNHLIEQADVVLGSSDLFLTVPQITAIEKPLVVDLESPTFDELPASRWPQSVSDLRSLLKRGDFFLCSSERQRDFWLGALLATDRINPLTYERDVTLRQLIDVEPCHHSQQTGRRVSQSLASFCVRPHRGIDRAIRMHQPIPQGPPTPILELPARALAMWREGGLGMLLGRITKHVRWRLSHKHLL